MRTAHSIRRAVAAIITASVVGVVGVSTLAPETAQAAGVVVQHRVYDAEAGAPPRDEE